MLFAVKYKDQIQSLIFPEKPIFNFRVNQTSKISLIVQNKRGLVSANSTIVAPRGIPRSLFAITQKAHLSRVGVQYATGILSDALLFAQASALAQESLPTCSIPRAYGAI